MPNVVFPTAIDRRDDLRRPGRFDVYYGMAGTLAESKSPLDAEMSGLLYVLLGVVKVAVISGGAWPQFEAQVLSNLPRDERLINLSLLPTCGTKSR